MPPADFQSLLDPGYLARIQNYALMARTAVEGYLSGMHQSIFHGFGVEFLQYRNYTPGEDLKNIDWKVYARREKLLTKVFQEETNMTVWLLVDGSASLDYQGDRAAVSKDRYARMVAACLAHMVLRQGDLAGLCLYGGELNDVIEPGNRSGQLERLLRPLAMQPASGRADHEAVFRYLERQQKGRSLIILISDLLEVEDDLIDNLRRLRTRRSDAIALQVLDPDELDLPELEAVRYLDAESGGEVVTSPAGIRETYNERMAGYQRQLNSRLSSAGVSHAVLPTNRHLGSALAHYLDHRQRFPG